MDTSALEAMGYEFLDGITAGGGRDEGVAGQYFAYSFKDTLLPDGSNTVDRWGEYVTRAIRLRSRMTLTSIRSKHRLSWRFSSMKLQAISVR